MNSGEIKIVQYGNTFQAAGEDVSQVVPRLVLSYIPLEFCDQFLPVLSDRKEISGCRDANAEELHELEFAVLQGYLTMQHVEQLS